MIKLAGVGGGATNLVGCMLDDLKDVAGLETLIINTDQESLAKSRVRTKLLIGPDLCNGEGTGGRPETGRQAALAAAGEIGDAITGADAVFIISTLGGGTGGGAARVLADIAKTMGITTIALVTLPLAFESRQCRDNAEQSLADLTGQMDVLTVVANERVKDQAGKDADFAETLNSISGQAVQAVKKTALLADGDKLDAATIQAMMDELFSSVLKV